jgi:hypothetical protein
MLETTTHHRLAGKLGDSPAGRRIQREAMRLAQVYPELSRADLIARAQRGLAQTPR